MTLREQIAEYVQHKPGCRHGVRSCGLVDCDRSHDPEPCSCGLVEFLASLDPRQDETGTCKEVLQVAPPARDGEMGISENILVVGNRATVPGSSLKQPRDPRAEQVIALLEEIDEEFDAILDGPGPLPKWAVFMKRCRDVLRLRQGEAGKD